MKIDAYLRPDGRLGVRNHVVIIPAVLCASEIAGKIAQRVEGVVTLAHTGGCTCGEDVAQTEMALAGLGANPNVAGVLVLGLGCENCSSEKIAERIAQDAPWKPLERLVIQELGISPAIDEGSRMVRQMIQDAAQWQRVEAGIEGLTLAVQCGGSDATSGLAANPALGLACDRLIAEGGSVMFSETTECIGAEHLLARRAVDDQVARQIVEIVKRAEQLMTLRLAPGEHFLTTGNMEGGLTTLEEKSLGCVCKTGSAPLVEVLEYGRQPRRRGLIFVDGTGFDVPSITGMIAAGAQMVGFTTGRGSPVGYPIAPVVKITGNPDTYRRLGEVIDINAGTIVQGQRTIEEVGEEIFRSILTVAGGRPSKAESFGFRNFALSTVAGAHAGV